MAAGSNGGEIKISQGTRLNNRYRLTEPLGRGGMAEVWLAQDEMLGRQVAVKVLLSGLATDQQFTKRFHREAAAMAAITQNSHLVDVYDFGIDVDNHAYYIIMQYVPGNDLKGIIKDNGPVKPVTAARIGIQICDALTAIHSAGVTHNDIKPANIRIRTNGEACVMDLGIFKPTDPVEQSESNMVLGTVSYCSPEQCRGESLTPASDLYALGILLYEITSGDVPFKGEDATEIAIKQCEELPRPLYGMVQGVDERFDAIVMKALEKEPENRFRSAEEMKLALESYLKGIGMSEQSTTVMGAVPAAADATSVMAPTNANAATRYGTDGQNGEEDDNGKKKLTKNQKIGIGIGVAVALIAIIAIVAVALTGSSKVQVPDVYGMDESTAVSTIESAGLKVSSTESVASSDVEEGKAVGTDPSAGTEVNTGSSVKLQISSGEETTEVPDVSGMTETAAIAAIRSAGLVPQKGNSVSSDTVSSGNVVSTDPSAKSQVKAGSTVTYSLSSGSATVSVPDVTGMTEANAKSELDKVGLKYTTTTAASDTVEAGRVISQNPTSGIKIAAGESISLVISSGVESVTVPSVTGLTQSAARSTLVNAGLKLGNVTEEYSNEASGTVVSQSVSDGTSVNKGTSIDIVISKGPENTHNSNSSSNSSNSSGNSSGNNNNTANNNDNDND